jgi:hypothetical protein
MPKLPIIQIYIYPNTGHSIQIATPIYIQIYTDSHPIYIYTVHYSTAAPRRADKSRLPALASVVVDTDLLAREAFAISTQQFQRLLGMDDAFVSQFFL